MFSSKKVMFALSLAVILLAFSIINFSFPLGLSASEKDLTNNQADGERAESETVEEAIEYPPMPDPSMPPEKALSEGKMIYIKQVTRRPKGYIPVPSLPVNKDINHYQPEKDRPVGPPERETVSGKAYNFAPIINDLVTESVVQSVYTDKDKEAKEDKDFPVKNRSGLYNAGFSLRSGKNLLKFSYGGSSLLMAPADIASVTGKVYSNTILYESIYPDTDLRYTVEDNRLKEDIIVKKKTGSSDFYFQLTVINAVHQRMPEGEIHFFDSSSGLPLFYMARPFAEDSNGTRCDLVSVDISNEGLLRLAVDPQWLNKAAYPVTIDPTIYLSNSEGGGSGIKPYWNYTGMSLGGGWGVSVNTYNLNLIINKTLFAVPGRGIPIGEAVTYNSLDGRVGALGSGWRLAAESSLIEQGDGSVIYSQGDGSVHSFTPNGSGGYTAPPGIYLTLQKTGPGNFTITDKAFNVRTYQNGKPTQVVDRDSNTTTYVYDGNGRIWKLRDPSGREHTYSYNAAGQVISITDPAGRPYQFAYQNGRLTTVIDPINNTVNLGYDANGRLSSFTAPLNRVTSFTCSSDGKLQSYRDARTAGQDVYETRFAQNTGAEVVTTVTDPGNISSYFYHNPSTGNLTKFQDQLGNIWTYSWNSNNLTSATDARGTTSYEYDSRGNVTKETVTVDGNPANNIVKTMTYDQYNQLLEIEDGGGRKKSYKYNNRGNLLHTSDPNRKESNGRLYDQYGNVVEYSPSVSSTYNLLKNGSMEITGDNTLLYGWSTNYQGASASLEGFQSHGHLALKISSGSPDKSYTISQCAYGNSSALLTLRADIKLDNVQPSGADGGAFIEISYGLYNYERLYCWGTGTVPVVITSTAAINPNITVGLINATGTAWFDGVQLEKAYISSDGYTLGGFNLLENGSFENGLEFWQYYGATPTVSTEAAWGGTRSVKLTHTSNRSSNIRQGVNVYGGEPLTFSGMVKTENVNGTGAYFIIEYYNSLSQLITGATVQTGFTTGTQDYTRLTCVADVPAEAAWCKVQAILEGTGAVYFDDLKLIPRNTVRYTYNAAGNYVVTTEDALGKKIRRAYNESTGTETSFKDALNNTTYYGYDNLDRLTGATDPLSRSAYYDYDGSSYLTDTRDPRSASSADNTYRARYVPTSLNQLGTLTDPQNRSATYTYNRSGDLTKIVLPNGMERNFSYDNARRLSRKTLDGGRYFDYNYDGANNLTAVTDQNGGTYTWTYDGAGRVTSSTNTFGHRLDYAWDKSHNVAQYDNVFYSYDSSNRSAAVTAVNFFCISYYYDENGRLFYTKHPLQNTYHSMISYHPNGWISRILNDGFPGRYPYVYNYYDNGNISSIQSWAGSESFTYDACSRLISWNYNGAVENYQYDAAGNILTKGGSVYTYNNANQVTNSGFTCDTNGNLTSDGTFSYTYNAGNQLTQVRKVSDGSLLATYEYNQDGLRKSKTVYTGGSPVTTYFHWDIFGNLVNDGTHHYIYNPGGSLIGMHFGSTPYYFHKNLRGDVVSVTDLNSNVASQYHYDPWGKIISSSGAQNQPFRYAGYYYDEETGLYYCKSRYYSPTLGRFLTKDSHGFIQHGDPQTLNLYAYCGNNPVNFTDPTGHWMDGDENIDFTPEETDEMEQLGKDWRANPDQRDDIHGRADEIRQGAKDRMRGKLQSITGYDLSNMNDREILEAYKHDLKIIFPNDKTIVGKSAGRQIIQNTLIGGVTRGPSGAFIGFFVGGPQGGASGYFRYKVGEYLWEKGGYPE